MDSHHPSYEFDNPRNVVVEAPLVEALQDPQRVVELWPEISEAHAFARQIEQHAKYTTDLDAVLDNLPHPTLSLESAVEAGFVSEYQVSELYNSLTALLEDPDYARLSLYLPFEFLPDASWNPKDSQLQEAIEQFKRTYLNSWGGLLSLHDVRANFADGIITQEADGLPRVVKAAHLIPQLIERGLFTETEALELFHTTEDAVLRQSLADVLEAFHGNTADVPTVQTDLPPELITEAVRVKLEKERHHQAIMATAKPFTEAVTENDLPEEVIASILSEETEAVTRAAFIEGVYIAIESAAMTDKAKAEALSQQYSEVFAALWEHEDAGVKKQLTRAYRRLHRLGVVDQEQLIHRDINLPNLGGQFSENLALFPNDIENLRQITEAIAAHPELRDLIYPVATVGGSRLKGYSEADSDIGVSVFIKPDTPHSARARVHELLTTTFAVGDTRYDPKKFWLDEYGDGGLYIHDFADQNKRTADRFWAHILFGDVWIGDKQAIAELQTRLLPVYFYESNQTIGGRTARQLYLERIEQDLLQYRLMHKGYQRHYPRYSLPTANQAIDGKSLFWDSGYRQLATKLFVSKVFLPKIIR